MLQLAVYAVLLEWNWYWASFDNLCRTEILLLFYSFFSCVCMLVLSSFFSICVLILCSQGIYSLDGELKECWFLLTMARNNISTCNIGIINFLSWRWLETLFAYLLYDSPFIEYTRRQAVNKSCASRCILSNDRELEYRPRTPVGWMRKTAAGLEDPVDRGRKE